jgi:hypothetical protein
MENTTSSNYNLQTFESPDVSDFKPPNSLFYINERGPKLFPFDPANVIINQFKPNNNGRGKSAAVEYKLEIDGKTLIVPLRIQTPKMNVMFGYNERISAIDGKMSTPNIGLSFRNKDSNPEVRSFYQAMWLLDQRIRGEAHKHYKMWFVNRWRDLEKTPAVIDAIHYALTRIGTDKNGQQYPPTFNIKCKKTYNAFTFQVFSPPCGNCQRCNPKSENEPDPDSECVQRLTAQDISRGTSTVAVVEMKHVWITDKYGISCDLLQCQLFKNPFTDQCAIVGSGDDDGVCSGDGTEHKEPTTGVLIPIAGQKRKAPEEASFVVGSPSASKSDEPAAKRNTGDMSAILGGMLKAARDM